MTPDLKLATIFVLPLGGAGAEDVVKHLEQHKRFVRGGIAKRVDLRFMPEIRFKADSSFASSQRIDELLASPKVARDLDT
jgi:ribosome-binding factor A